MELINEIKQEIELALQDLLTHGMEKETDEMDAIERLVLLHQKLNQMEE
jgi:hypothetical protein